MDSPAELPPATDDAALAHTDQEPELAIDLAAEDAPATDDAQVESQPEQQEDAADLGAEHLQDSADGSDDAAVAPAEQQDDAADLGAEHLQDVADDVLQTADQEPGAATKCAYCDLEFGSGEQRQMIEGRLYHRGFCAKYGGQIAIAAE